MATRTNPIGLGEHELDEEFIISHMGAIEFDKLPESICIIGANVEGIEFASMFSSLGVKVIVIDMDPHILKGNDEDLKNSDEYGKRLGEVAEENSKAIAKNLLVIEELGKLVDTINKSYVSKSEFNELVNRVKKFKTLVAKELKDKSKPKGSSLSKMSNGDIETKAKAFYDKQYYTKGLEYYNYLITKNYKPANSYFMVGQMNFKRKNYAEAISYYKKSAALYSKASYMPELMLNTAISMDKTNDKKNAKAFYNGIILKFPDSPEAKSAKKYLNNI